MRAGTACGCAASTAVPGGKYGGDPVTRSNGPSSSKSRRSPSRTSTRSLSPLYRTLFRASRTDIACASMVTRRAPNKRQATTSATDPIPDPRSAALPHIDTILESVVPDTLPRQPHGHRLRLDGDDPRANQTPRHDERHRPNTRPKVRRPPHPRRPLRRIPGGEDVIGREAMPIGILEDAVMPRDVVERLPDLRLDASGREGAGTKPATVMEVGGHGGGMVVHLRWSCLAGSGFRASV